ncbi:MAG: hypothetical protein AB7H77_09210 [Bdellovibrionales bacterium]
MNNSTSSLNVLDELTSIRDYVLNAQRELQAGRMPDMWALEQRTGELCRIIQQATSDVQMKCAPELKELARQLDDCEQELRSMFQPKPDPLDD